MTGQAVMHPLGMRDLPEGQHACADCGLPCSGPTEEFVVVGRVRAELDMVEPVEPPRTVEFGRCHACRTRYDDARHVVDSLPALRGTYGSPDILAYRLRHVLIALDALERARSDSWTVAMVGDALTRLEGVGAAFCWSRRFAPVQHADAKRDTAASQPFLYAAADTWDEARWQANEFAVDRITPHPIAHPDGSGCAVCGRATFPARRPTEAWHPTPSGRYAGRWVCSACYRPDVVLGPTAVNQALLAHLDGDREYRRRRGFTDPMFTLPMWADSGASPTSEPWGWADLRPALKVLQSGAW